jgi:hypothetical protein
VTDDLPRRSFPLVVPPPGGFEDAVRRGRRRRRKQTGSSSALVLSVVAALTWSVAGHDGGGGTNRLSPANDDPRVTQTEQVPGGPAATTPPHSPRPTDSGSAPRSGQAAGSPSPVVHGSAPAVSASPTVRHQVERPPGGGVTTRPYAARPTITRTEDQALSCIPGQGEDWCAIATGTQVGTDYHLEYAVCRAVTAGAITLHFRRHQEADFVATDLDHADQVWTYSKGQPIGTPAPDVTFDAGECVLWAVDWDGYDDYHRTPVEADYTVTARLLSEESMPTATSPSFHHE